MRHFKVFSIIIVYSFCLSVMAEEANPKKVIKESDLANFVKDSKFSGEALDQEKIDKEMAILEEKDKEKNSNFIMLLDECSKHSDEDSYKACKLKVSSNK